ncbi:S-formylglutathione hydrolase FrmB [Jatrophihabitans endophyticus]|uniref:Acyl-CoA:diacylglycerol acyltransferase n=1 Tax=Jatrophihabitans endophyticus TaxID=1206085 RepID=A0A1M5LKH8_9ACTN|nr:alpha/beta hydrolase-fold protein [Jatrophihabitans endophyticus]SHG64873.1 S-formylglutathione hydrolase FrmB [Jatrophihabitans endophyticus]
MTDRRRFLLGGAAVLAGIAGTLAACGADDTVGIVTGGTFRSRYRHAATGWTIARPAGHAHDRLPVLVALHARGGDHGAVFTNLRLDRVLADVVGSGTAPFAIASVDGGDHEYWHPRRGTDPAGMVVHEFLPLLARHDLDTRRVAFIGWSMGGYGALYLATVLGRGRVAALVAESPAMWHRAGQRVEGSFDDDADFDRHAVLPRASRLDGIPARISCGDRDGFRYVVTDLRARIRPRPAGGIEPGGHDDAYWRSQLPADLRFAGRHLARP